MHGEIGQRETEKRRERDIGVGEIIFTMQRARREGRGVVGWRVKRDTRRLRRAYTHDPRSSRAGISPASPGLPRHTGQRWDDENPLGHALNDLTVFDDLSLFSIFG